MENTTTAADHDQTPPAALRVEPTGELIAETYPIPVVIEVNCHYVYIIVTEGGIGERAFKGNFMYAEPFSEGLACVKFENGRWGFITPTGEKAFEATFEWARPFSEGLACVKFRDGSYGFINKTGEKAFKATFRRVSPFNEGLACVEFEKGRFGFITKTGKKAFKATFGETTSFSEGFAVVELDNGLYGYITPDGRMAFEAFERAYPFYKGFACVRFFKDGPWEYLDHTGKMFTKEEVDRIREERSKIPKAG